VLILDIAPEPLDKNIVQRPAPSVHTDLNPIIQQDLCEFRGGELTSLVSIEYLRFYATFQGVLKGPDTKINIHRVG